MVQPNRLSDLQTFCAILLSFFRHRLYFCFTGNDVLLLSLFSYPMSTLAQGSENLWLLYYTRQKKSYPWNSQAFKTRVSKNGPSLGLFSG